MTGIVVGLDGSDASSLALRYAVREAARTGAEVHGIHAWTTPVWMGGIPGFGYNALASPEESRRIAEELLAHQVAQLRDAEPDAAAVEIRTTAIEGSARAVLVTASESADLLVLASHGEGHLHGLVIGSVAQHVLNHAECPVLLVPAAGTNPAPVGRVVVGADGSKASRVAMQWALESARHHECPLVVVHAWMFGTVPGRPAKHFVASSPELETECQEWLDREVQEVLPDPGGVKVSTELSYSSAVWALREAAGPHDQLVVGTRGQGGFAGLLLGSVATQCTHYAQGVVVVVPAERGPRS